MGELAVPVTVALASVLVLVVSLSTVRRLVLARAVGSFDCSVRTGDGAHGWSVGVARYGPDRIDWFRVFSLSLRPSRVYERRRLTLVDTRVPQGGETFAVLPGVRVVACRYDGTELDLAMSGDACTGLSSWLEASPPGQVSRVT